MKDGFLTLHTTLAPEVLREKLKQWEPWGYRLDFDNGVPTRDCARLTLFAERPLDKFALFESAVPFAELGGGRLLDVGCNAGYNSIHAAVKYHFFTTGIDISPRHIEVGRFLASRARHPSSSWAAETFSRPREFDIILHFGTLYHLPNPLLSLSQSFENLKPGGYLALETQVYDHPRVEVLSARARSTAKVLYGRLSELYMDGALGLDPPDRSFVYGYVICWASVWTESLNSLVVLQVFVGAGTARVLASTCRLIFQLPPRLSYVFGILCAIDPLQLLWLSEAFHTGLNNQSHLNAKSRH